MPFNNQFSVLSSSALTIARAIDSYDLDSVELFRQAGLDHSRLQQPLSRFPHAAIQQLWALAVDASGDPCFGLRVASYWHPTSYHALGYSWLASRNLEEAFERLVRYSYIINTAARDALYVEKSADSFDFIADIDKVIPPPHPIALESGMTVILSMCRAAYGKDFRPLEVTMRHPVSGCADRFAEIYQAPVRFGQECYSMRIDPAVASESLATANPELVRVNDQIVTDYLARLDRDDIVMRVRKQLIERLPSGRVDEGGIAAAIHMSRRSMQRKLRERGVSFSHLLESTRRELSLQYVRDSQHALNEIAYLVGFSEPANFSRAFKRWYGQPPSRFREPA